MDLLHEVIVLIPLNCRGGFEQHRGIGWIGVLSLNPLELSGRVRTIFNLYLLLFIGLNPLELSGRVRTLYS